MAARGPARLSRFGADRRGEMEELARLRSALEASRSNVRASQRSLRTTGQFLADLEDRLAECEALLGAGQPAQPQEAQRNDNRNFKLEAIGA